MNGEWRLIREEVRDGATNMALDEIAAETAANGGPRTVRVYQWEPSCLTLGYRQAPDTVDWAFCEESGIDVTRRQTGGGGIYHDHYGDIAYSIIAPKDELPGDLMATYDLLCEPILAFLRAIGVDARFVEQEHDAIYHPACYLRDLHPAHDMVAGAGRKIAGNAQYRRKDSVIQHGSITFSVDAPSHLGVFTDGPSESRFRERVTGIDEQVDIDRADAVDALEAHLESWADADEGGWTDDELARARERAKTKYRSDSWNRERTDPTD
ncbi:lipoate--protein ligase family protein [Natronomonas sp. EA1]|uniref:lipoate--protein ligase family protein n=1 Tax=Natronomonas sp. EA1 TaxID=3421655 RepID=UPI003EBB48BD